MEKITKEKATEIKKRINYYAALLEVGGGIGAANTFAKGWKKGGGFSTSGGFIGGLGLTLSAGFSAAVGFKYLADAANAVIDYFTEKDTDSEVSETTENDEKEDSEEYDSEE